MKLLSLTFFLATLTTLTFGQTSIRMPATGGAITVNATVSTGGATAAVTTNAVWIHPASISSSVSSTGSTTTALCNVDATTVPRTGLITMTYPGVAPVVFEVRQAGKITLVSAASYSAARLAPGGLASIFGMRMTDAVYAATALPLPVVLGTVQAEIVNTASGATAPCKLLYVNPTQVNLQLPESPVGSAVLYLTAKDGSLYSDTVYLQELAIDVFTINSTGTGDANLTVQRNFTSGVVNYETPNYVTDGTNYFLQPADVKSYSGENVYLLFYGTALHGVRTGLQAQVDGLIVPVLYAGPQGFFAGIDQLAIKVPAGLPVGSHAITFSGAGITSNTIVVPTR